MGQSSIDRKWVSPEGGQSQVMTQMSLTSLVDGVGATVYGYDAAGDLNYRTNNALLQQFNVNDSNELTKVTHGRSLTVAGATTSVATNVTVNSLTATLYSNDSFAKDGFTIAGGNNTFTRLRTTFTGGGRPTACGEPAGNQWLQL